jgi:protoporphyrinogen oxidase
MNLRVPDDVVDASEKLACSSCVLVNIGINREDISEVNWSYFYDRDVFFARLCFPHTMSPNNVPSSASSIKAEVYYSKKHRPLDRSPQECIQPVIKDLYRCGLLQEEDKIIFSNAKLCRYANIIYDMDRADSLATIHGYLDDIGINYCGRYGEWGHPWTDESFVSGENEAQRVLNKLSS